LAQLAALGATGHGIDRRLFSAEDAQARTLFAQWARASKFTVEQDRAGNVFARRAGKRDGAAILSGSHLDTVPNGGAYDGAYGAVAALCALEELDAAGVVTEHPVEAVAWAGEEGSRFPLGCLGSAAFAGLNDLAAIEGFDEETAGELQSRAVEYIEARNREMDEERRSLGVEDSITEVAGVSPPMLVALGKAGIKSLEDLAGCATDDLLGYYEVNKEKERVRIPGALDKFNLTADDASEIVMDARVKIGRIEAPTPEASEEEQTEELSPE